MGKQVQFGVRSNSEILEELDATENPVTRSVLKDVCIKRLRDTVTDENTLVEAVWQVLDDMGKEGLSCCLAAKAQLRIAYEPFNDGEAEPEMSLKAAIKILKDIEERT